MDRMEKMERRTLDPAGSPGGFIGGPQSSVRTAGGRPASGSADYGGHIAVAVFEPCRHALYAGPSGVSRDRHRRWLIGRAVAGIPRARRRRCFGYAGLGPGVAGRRAVAGTSARPASGSRCREPDGGSEPPLPPGLERAPHRPHHAVEGVGRGFRERSGSDSAAWIWRPLRGGADIDGASGLFVGGCGTAVERGGVPDGGIDAGGPGVLGCGLCSPGRDGAEPRRPVI